MRKSNHPTGQMTLFRSWNMPPKKKKSYGLFQTWDTKNSSCSTSTSSLGNIEKQTTAQNKKYETEKSLDDIINIDDDDEDNELLASIDESVFCEVTTNSHDVGNLSFSASTNDDGGDVITGFDCSTGSSWIYPTNYPLRDYQFNIVQKALFHNTLVTLPTGLGKTFIAAVVMYNFYRWYPQGKIVFMAPTKPLVAQQIDACYKIMGIPRQDTAEMTGNICPANRKQFWRCKRVFFLTPQVFQNDLSRGSCRADDVVCLVFDEAHKALGNHSYCQVVREVLGYTKNFRVLALSATPGDGIENVQDVITNLLVSRIELRSEDSIDIKPYTHQRRVEKIVIKLGEELEFFKTKFLRVLNTVVNRLFNYHVLFLRDASKVNKGILISARETFREKCAAGQQPQRQIGPIEGDFAVALSLYHSYDLLLQHGMLPFYKSIKEIADGNKGTSRAKTELTRNLDFIGILDDLREQIESPPDQCDGKATTSFDVSPKGFNVKPSFVGHPKLEKLKDIVLEHFRACEGTDPAGNSTGSRVMIFSQFRDSVQEISRMLSEHKPLVKAMSFVGQQSKGNSSKGLTQKEQLEVVRKFRSGGYNTLVATCVAEEGLDIGEVDLIICFDASASPTRLVQRMGRTGRKRDGRIIVLVTEGKEDQIYQRSQRKKANIHKAILDSAQKLELYLENPRMVPKHIKPVCQKMFISVDDAKSSKNKSKSSKTSTKKSADGNIKKMFSASSKKNEGFLSPEELRYWNDNFKLPLHDAGLTPSKSSPMRPRERHSTGQRYLETEPALSLTEWTAWQTPLQQVHYVDHSKRSRHFTEILEFCDFQRDCGDNGDNYDMEMRSFLNLEDILQPGDEAASTLECVLENGAKKKNKIQKQREKKKTDVVVAVEDGEDKTNMAKKNGDRNSFPRTEKESRSNKRKSADFGFDIDDDFEDVSPTNKAIDKTSRKNPAHSKPSLEKEVEEISPARKHAESSFSLTNNLSETNLSFVTSQSKLRSNVTAKNTTLFQSDTTPFINEESSEFPQEWNDERVGRENNLLAKLLDIPSSPRQRKVARSMISEVIPDAPSLDTLLDLSALDTGEDQEDKGDFLEGEDRFPSKLTETPKTSKTYNNSNKHSVKSRKAGKKFSDEVSDGIVSVKPCSSKKSENVDTQNVSEKASKSEKIGSIVIKSPIFGSGLVCDTDSRNKHDDGIDFDLNQELARSFFDDDEIDRALRDLQTPFFFSDDECENTIDKIKKTSSVYPETEKVNTTKNNLETPCLFDDEEFENGNEKTLEPRSTNKRLSHRSFCLGREEFSIKTEHFAKLIDEKSMPQRKLSFEHSVDCERTSILKSRVNEHSLNKIRSFSFAKPTAEQAESLNVMSGPRDEDLNLPVEYCNDVVAPSPSRRKSSLYSGKVASSKNRSFRCTRELFSVKTVCGEKDDADEAQTCQNKRRMFKLQCKSKEESEDLKSSQGVQVVAKIKLPKLELKRSPFKIVSSYPETKPKNKEKDVSQITGASSSLGQKKKKSELTSNVCPPEAKSKESFHNKMESDIQRNLSSKSTLMRTSLFGKNQSKVELYDVEVVKPLQSSSSSSFLHELIDEEVDSACLSPPFKLRSSLCKAKDRVCLKEDKVTKESMKKGEILEEKSFESFPHKDATVEDSPLVIKTKATVRSKSLRDRLLESDDEDECGGEKSEHGDVKQVTKAYHKDLDKEGSVVNASESKKRSSFRNQRNNILETSDSDDKFEEQKTVKRKRKMPVHEQSKNNIVKKRRPLFGDFIDDEAEVSEEDGGHYSSDHEDGLSNEYLDDSFVDDRSQLTQRSPLTVMKQKKKDESINMMDIYRLSLLSPHRQQLRFQTPVFNRSKNRYKMVYNQPRNISSSPTDDDHDVSVTTEESDEMEDASMWEDVGTTVPSASPDESQIVVRKRRRGKRRVLEESYLTSPEATTADSDQQTKLSLLKKSLGTTPTQVSCTDVKDTEKVSSINSKDSLKSPAEADKTIFKRPTNTVSMNVNRGLNGVKKASTGYSGYDENIEDIMAALDDADDELLMMEIDAIPSLSTVFKDNCLGKNCAGKTLSDTLVPSRKTLDNVSSDSLQGGISSKPGKPQRTFGNVYSCGNTNMNSEKRNEIPSLSEKPNLSRCLQNPVTKTKPIEILSKENENRNERTTNQTKCKPQNSLNGSHQRQTVSATNAKAENKTSKVSPLFPPLSTTTSSKGSTSYTHVLPGKTAAQISCSEKTKLCTTDVSETTVNPTTATSPALTATQRDKNKLTILVGSKEVSNCQIVSLLRRKHNMKAVVSQITGCDYIVSTRMAVDRKFVSDISCQANFNKLITRVRELCDLYDRPCIVIEKDRVKNGETQVKCEVRSKFYDRVLACLAHTHIKVLFSDSQEGTSDILASLAEIEEKKNHAIIYPLPLSEEKEQAMLTGKKFSRICNAVLDACKMVKFLSSIPRTSYITAVSLCYHNKTLQELINSSAEGLVKRVKNLSLKRANDILKFLQHVFCADMVNSGTT